MWFCPRIFSVEFKHFFITTPNLFRFQWTMKHQNLTDQQLRPQFLVELVFIFWLSLCLAFWRCLQQNWQILSNIWLFSEDAQYFLKHVWLIRLDRNKIILLNRLLCFYKHKIGCLNNQKLMNFGELQDILDGNCYVPSCLEKPKDKNKKPLQRKPSQQSDTPSANRGQRSTISEKNNVPLGFSRNAQEKHALDLDNYQNPLQDQPTKNLFSYAKTLKRNNSSDLGKPQTVHEPSKNIDSQNFPSLGKPQKMHSQFNLKNDTEISQKNSNISQKRVESNERFSRNRKRQSNDLDIDPIKTLQFEEPKIQKKAIKQQKSTIQSSLQEEKMKHKNEIEYIKRMHNEEIKEKMNFKDMEIKKIKELYEMEINMSRDRKGESQSLQNVQQKMELNYRAIQRFEQEFKNCINKIERHKEEDKNLQFKKRDENLYTREKALIKAQQQIEYREKELEKDKERFYEEYRRDQEQFRQKQQRLMKRENELEANYKRKMDCLIEESEEKRKKFNKQYDEFLLRQRANQEEARILQEQKKGLQKKMRQLEVECRRQQEEIYIEKMKVMQKSIQITAKANELDAKERDIDMTQQELKGKLKLLEMERQKLAMQSKGNDTLKTGFNLDTLSTPSTNTWKYESKFSKSILELRDQYLKQLPTFSK